ncbi:MAG: hypothetical protein ACRYGL_09595 [Janthinobacterium lividum]
MIKKIAAAVVFLACSVNAQWASAQSTPLPGVGFKLGDDVATVKEALKTNAETEPMARNPLLPANVPDVNQGKTVLHLRTKGIWVFFNPSGNVQTIRLDAPFGGNVLGVKIGDKVAKISEKLGSPIKKPATVPLLNTQSYQYVIDDSAYVNFLANEDGVQIIFITR